MPADVCVRDESEEQRCAANDGSVLLEEQTRGLEYARFTDRIDSVADMLKYSAEKVFEGKMAFLTYHAAGRHPHTHTL